MGLARRTTKRASGNGPGVGTVSPASLAQVIDGRSDRIDYRLHGVCEMLQYESTIKQVSLGAQCPRETKTLFWQVNRRWAASTIGEEARPGPAQCEPRAARIIVDPGGDVVALQNSAVPLTQRKMSFPRHRRRGCSVYRGSISCALKLRGVDLAKVYAVDRPGLAAGAQNSRLKGALERLPPPTAGLTAA